MFSLHDLDLLQTTLKWRLKCVQSRTIRNKTKIQSNPLRSYPPTRQVNDFSWIGTWCLLHSWPCHLFFSIVFERLWFCFVSKHFARYSLWKSIEIEETTGIILKAFVAFWWQNRNAVFKFEGNQRKENTIEGNFFRRFIVVQGNMWRILMRNQ